MAEVTIKLDNGLLYEGRFAEEELNLPVDDILTLHFKPALLALQKAMEDE